MILFLSILREEDVNRQQRHAAINPEAQKFCSYTPILLQSYTPFS